MSEPNTSSTAGARAHARAQAAAARFVTPAADDVDPAEVTWAQRVPPGSYANVVLGRGTRIRLTDPEGGACAHLLLLRAEAPWERLNVADTVKVPWQAYLSTGHPLLSDQGRVLATIVADSSGSHDALCGPTAAGRNLLRLAGSKQGLAPRDIAPTVSFFRGVRVAEDGGLVPTGGVGPGGAVDLLVHLPVILLVANAPHPLDERATTDLDLLAWSAPETPSAGDPEYLRAVANTESAWTALTLEHA
ncbi:DUF1989 domain-containing protein [Nocardia sp. NPDC048505]|uniref:DUF1989 domain-containing protein n=1 Tax=unclassified Nocardia TaxID=2637762 RepID=UPI0033F16147